MPKSPMKSPIQKEYNSPNGTKFEYKKSNNISKRRKGMVLSLGLHHNQQGIAQLKKFQQELSRIDDLNLVYNDED